MSRLAATMLQPARTPPSTFLFLSSLFKQQIRAPAATLIALAEAEVQTVSLVWEASANPLARMHRGRALSPLRRALVHSLQASKARIGAGQNGGASQIHGNPHWIFQGRSRIFFPLHLSSRWLGPGEPAAQRLVPRGASAVSLRPRRLIEYRDPLPEFKEGA